MRKPGCVEPVVYFVCGDPTAANPPRPVGWIVLAPYSGCPTPPGYRSESVDTLHDIDDLEATLQRQCELEHERDANANSELVRAAHQRTRDSLYARMTRSATSEYEKDFIRAWLRLRHDHPRKNFYTESLQCYLWARHNDTPKNRQVDEEKVSLDRVNF